MEEQGESQEMRGDEDTKSISQMTGEAEASIDYTVEQQISLSSRLRGIRERFYDTFVNWDYGFELCEVVGVVDYSEYYMKVEFLDPDSKSTFTKNFITSPGCKKSINDLLLTTNSSSINELIGKKVRFKRVEPKLGRDKKILLKQGNNTVLENIKYYSDILAGKLRFVGVPKDSNDLINSEGLQATPLWWFASLFCSTFILFVSMHAYSLMDPAGPLGTLFISVSLIALIFFFFFISPCLVLCCRISSIILTGNTE